MIVIEPMTVRRAIGTRIRLAREAQGLSQIELSRLVHRSKAWIASVELGIREPSLSKFIAIALALHQDPIAMMRKALPAPVRQGDRSRHGAVSHAPS